MIFPRQRSQKGSTASFVNLCCVVLLREHLLVRRYLHFEAGAQCGKTVMATEAHALHARDSLGGCF